MKDLLSTTPQNIKYLIYAILALTLIKTQITALLGIASPLSLLGLSVGGISKGYIWQIFTSLLFERQLSSLTFSSLLSLFCTLYFLAVASTAISNLKSSRSFFKLIVFSSLSTSLITLSVLFAFSSSMVYASLMPIFITTLTAMLMLYPEQMVILFFSFPFKIKWLAAVIIVGNIVVEILAGHLIIAVSYIIPFLFTYSFAYFSWSKRAPIAQLEILDKLLSSIGATLSYFSKNNEYAEVTKVYDFKTGKAVITEDQFILLMRKKITAHGLSSLTLRERFRILYLKAFKGRNIHIF